MSQPRLSIRLVRLAAGVAIVLPAISMYGAAGAWADKPASPGNSAAAHAAADSAAPVVTVVAAAAAAPVADAPGNSDHAKQAAADPPGNSAKKDDAAPAAAAVATVTAATTTTVAAGSNGNSDHSKGNAATVGSPNSPQPLSNADKNSGGANGGCGDYCSTRDGSPSMNGNGNGGAGGKPCAGCVGKADNKNPPGQYKNGSDHNNGYECDGNNGVGKGNPAHTGCKPTPPVDCLGHLKSLGHSDSECPDPKDCLGHSKKLGHDNGECPDPKDCLGHSKKLGHDNGECPDPKDCLGHSKKLGHDNGECPDPKDCLGHSKSLGHDASECPPPPCTATNTCPPPPCTATNTCPPPPCALTGGCGGTTTGGGGGTTGGGSTGAAEGTTGSTVTPPKCPDLTGGSGAAAAGPMPKGCTVKGQATGAATALPFTGVDATMLLGIALLAAGLGLSFMVLGSVRQETFA